jgi:hypothetical protein
MRSVSDWDAMNGTVERFTTAADVEVKDSSGTTLRFSDLWMERPTVFLFLRHFG